MSDEWDGQTRRQTDRWHIGKEVPLAVLFMLLLQTGGGIWWLAQMSSKIDRALDTLAEFKAERFTKEDARRERELMFTLIEQIRSRDVEMERRIIHIEQSIARK
jgi:hypothetical protein